MPEAPVTSGKSAEIGVVHRIEDRMTAAFATQAGELAAHCFCSVPRCLQRHQADLVRRLACEHAL